MRVVLEPLQLVMWEKVDLPDSKRDQNTGEWVKTGNTVEKTRYVLRDEFGETLKFLSDNEYREMEGSEVSIVLDINYNDYSNTIKTVLKEINQLAS